MGSVKPRPVGRPRQIGMMTLNVDRFHSVAHYRPIGQNFKISICFRQGRRLQSRQLAAHIPSDEARTKAKAVVGRTVFAKGRDMPRERIALALAVVAAVALLAALGPWPYWYYTLLRFVICGVGGYTAFAVYKRHQPPLAWLLGLVAALFNPIVPMYLPRGVWQVLDVACAGLFVFVALTLQNPPRSEGQPKSTVRDRQFLFGSAALAFLAFCLLSGAISQFIDARTNTTGGYDPVDGRWVGPAEYRHEAFHGALVDTTCAAMVGAFSIGLLKARKEQPGDSPYSTL